MRTIYSLEDDLDIVKIIRVSLTKAGYLVKSFTNCHEFMDAFNESKPDMVLLDLMLPDASGMDVLKKIRSDKTNKNIKAVIISAKRLTMDKVEGLDNGADDYIEKPFDILELISRINARFREDDSDLCYENLRMNLDKHSVYLDDKEISLTNTEYEILRLLLSNIGKVISRETIFQEVYQSKEEIESRSIDMHVASLRKKLDKSIIKTIYGIGYLIG